MSAQVTIGLDEMVRLEAEAHGFSFLPRQPVASLLSGRHASRLRGRGLMFEELRAYAPGDDVRTIDWKATARLRSPQVRVYGEERERPVLLVVDQRRTMFFGSRRVPKSVAAAEFAALGAWRALAAGDRVGAVVFGDGEIVDLPPHRSRTRVLRILGEIARLNRALAGEPDGGPAQVTLDRALEAALRRATHDHLVAVVSDFDGADDETTRLITLLAAHNDVLAVAVYDPLGALLVGRPGMRAHDRGATFEVPPGDDFAASFRRVFAEVLDRWAVVFRALKVPVLPVSTAEPTALQLRELFGRRRDSR